MKGHYELRRVGAAALVCALGALLIPFEAVRVLFAVPLALFLPGYAIAAACFSRDSLDRPRFLLVSLVLSLSTLALGGLLLNYMPGGIRSLSWALLLLAVTGGGIWVAARRGPAAKKRRPSPARRRTRPKPAAVALLLGGLAAAVAALVLSATTVPADDVVGYTELWVLPEGGAESREAQVGVGSEEQTTVPYDLLVKVGERPLVRRAFSLAPGETRIVRLRTEPSPDGQPIPVTATLLRQNRTDQIYRRVRSWLPPLGPSR
jgi:uncharacterized membrane protein